MFGKLTELLMFPVWRKSASCWTAITAQLSSACEVLAPMCGNRITSPCLFALLISSGVGKSVIKFVR